MFYFMFVHSKVIFDKQTKKKKKEIYILVSYTNLPIGLWTIDTSYNEVVSCRKEQLLG